MKLLNESFASKWDSDSKGKKIWYPILFIDLQNETNNISNNTSEIKKKAEKYTFTKI